MEHSAVHDSQPFSGVSRRGFLKSALVSAGLASLSQYEVVAQMVGGSSMQKVRGWGVQPGLVQLSSNENALGPSPRAVEAVLKMTYGVNRYGLSPTLYRKIAQRHNVPEVDADSPFALPKDAWVTVGAGSSDILFALAHTFLGDGGELVEVIPGFGFMTRLAVAKGVKVVRIPLTKEYSPDLTAMHKAITPNTKMVVVTSPGNPNGKLTPMQTLKPFIESVPSYVTVVVDEAYIDFVDKPEDRIGAAPLIKDHPNVIVTRTFSKMYGLAGMRAGYGLAQPDVVNKLNAIRWNTLNILSGYGAAAALEDHEHVRRSRELAVTGKEYFYNELRAMGIEYVPSQTNFILINSRTDADTVVRKLAEEYNVLVGNAKQRWDMDNWIRVTVGLPEENEAFIAALKKVLIHVDCL